MNRVKNLLKMNPIIIKEVRSRMRGPRAFITLTIILILMGGIMYAMLQIILANSRYTTVLSPQIGQALFAALAYLELFMIAAVTPSVTSGAISSEKERLTYEMLMATPLSPARILWGKLISALSYVFLLLFAAIPLASVVFIFGGIALRDMVKVLIVLVFVAVTFGILGLFMSALFGRTGRATVASFVVVVGLMFGPLFLTVLVAAMRQGGEPPRWILSPSPISALAAALSGSIGASGGGELFYILGGIFNTGVSPISQTSIPRPLYHYSLPFYALFSLVLYMLSTRLVQPARRWKIRRGELLIDLAVFLIATGFVLGGFALTANRYENAVNQNNARPMSEPAIQQAGVAIAVPVQEERVVVADPLGNPTPTPINPPQAEAAPISEDDRAEIYAAVVRQLYFVDHTFGDNPPDWETIYLVTQTDDSVGDPNAPKSEPVILSKDLIGKITDQLSDVSAGINPVETRNSVTTDAQDGSVDGGKGVIFTVGNIHTAEGGGVQVSASLYFGSLGAGGKTYLLSKVDGVWTITGTTGIEWIS